MAINKYFSVTTSLGNKEEDELVEGLRYVAFSKMKKFDKDVQKDYGKDMPAGLSEKLSDLDDKVDEKDYKKSNEVVLKALMQYCAKRAGLRDDVNTLNGRAKKSPVFKDAFFSVISEAIAPVIPAYITYMYDYVADVRNVNYGDSAHFMIPNREIFTVNEMGSGKKRGAAQRLFDKDMTVVPTLKDITVYQDWYQIASGRADLGDFMFKVSMGFANDISKRVYDLIDASYASLPAALKYSGAYSDTEFTKIVQTLSAANGMKTYCLGTLLALQQVLPNNDFLKMPYAEEWGTMG